MSKKKNKKPKTISSPGIRVTIAGFPIAKNAFHNELWDWNTLKTIKL